MAISITHQYSSGIADAGDTSVVQPSDWNASHTLSGFGTGVETALAVNVGSAGAPVLFNGALGTPSSGTLTNCTLPVGGITGLGTGVATFLATPSSANLASAVTGETGSGALVFDTAPVFSTTVTIGAAGGTTGSLLFKGTTSGTVTIKPADAAGTYTLTLPTDDGNNNDVLKTDGNGILSWVAQSGGSIVGSDTQVIFNDGGSAYNGDSGLTYNKTTNLLTLTGTDGASSLLITSGSQTGSSSPALSITQTWNNGATAFTGILANFTNTASSNSTKVIDLQIGGTTVFAYVNFLGQFTFGTLLIQNNAGYQFKDTGGGQYFYASTGALTVKSGSVFSFSASSSDPTSAADTFIGRPAAATIRLGNVDAAAPVAQTLSMQNVVAGTANGTAGKDFTLKLSSGTGTGTAGNLIIQGVFSAKSSGTGQGTWVDRQIIVSKGKVLTDNTAVSLFEVALPTLTMCGGTIEACVVCTDGTDMQSFSQTVTYSAVNKGGSYTKSITATTGDKSVSAGTIVNTWSILDGTNKVTIQLSSDTSLTPSSNAFMVYYTVWNNSEQATTIL